MSSVLLRDVEVDGRRTDVRIEAGVISHVGRCLPKASACVDGSGGALLPGLHDHHLHLMALAAQTYSIDLSDLAGPAALAEALRQAATRDGWIRATGYHESTAGDLDRDVLDRIRHDVPLRVQHRSGALWVLNSAALDRVAGALDDSPGVERDARGRATGRLWRFDARLRAVLPAAAPDLAAVGRALARVGITGVTDATPDLDAGALGLLARARRDGALPQRITLLGAPDDVPLPPGLTCGPRKILLHDHDLPPFDELVEVVRHSHDRDRPVAVHCVTRHSLVLTLAVLEETGVLPGDRIEHAAVAPPEVAIWMARLGVAVVTQPDFVRTRGEAYRRDVDADDLPHLYPYASLLGAGVRTCVSSDAPYGAYDPWRVIATAAHRPLGPSEDVDATTALHGYLTPPDEPGGTARRVRTGAPADLVLLQVPLAEALRAPRSDLVRATWIEGRNVPAR